MSKPFDTLACHRLEYTAVARHITELIRSHKEIGEFLESVQLRLKEANNTALSDEIARHMLAIGMMFAEFAEDTHEFQRFNEWLQWVQDDYRKAIGENNWDGSQRA